MSEHEHERLSAYLDGELRPDEMSAVAAHVAACPECAARLAEFAAVDEAAAALAATAPSGYFEALPGRMRARLEPRGSAMRRLPVWTWAAAAALLLAVVTPLTLMKRSSLQMEPSPAREQPAAAPPPTLEAPAQPQSAPAAVPAVEAPPAKLQKVVQPPAATPAVTVPSRPAANAAPSSDERPKREQGFAAAPTDADREAQPAEPAAEARRDAPVGALRLPAPGALSRVEPQTARSRDAAAAQEESADKGARKAATAAPEPKAADAIAETLTAPAGETVQQNAVVGGVAGRTPAYTERDAAADEEWRRLQAARPQTVEEWRRLREELRRFADAAPAGPHADAARLRTIEAGYTAWRSGGDAADEAGFRRDAAAYLERGEDAKNKARVRGLLR
ncbi:MAG: zf-HC2 domain-containing protein [Burkholderiales bacterium]